MLVGGEATHHANEAMDDINISAANLFLRLGDLQTGRARGRRIDRCVGRHVVGAEVPGQRSNQSGKIAKGSVSFLRSEERSPDPNLPPYGSP